MSLPARVQLGYGAAELGINGVEVLIRVSLLIFYTDVVGLDPVLAGYAVALGVLWDALTDPLMGRISDTARWRLGRRRPFIALGALLLAGGVVVLFSPPAMQTQSGKFAVLLASYLFVNTALTIIAVPHSAFAGDLAPAGDLRVRLFGWRMLFANFGLVLGTALPGLLIAQGSAHGEARANADQASAIVLAGVVLAAAAMTLLATRGRDAPAPARTSRSERFAPALTRVLRNRSFWPLLGAFVIANVGLSLNASTALYYYRYRLRLEEDATRGIIALFMLVFCLSIPLWVHAARRFGAKPSLIAGACALGLMNCVVYLAFPVGNAWWPLTASVVGGLAIGSVVLLDAMLADVVDHERVRGGEARFGLYFGVWKMGAKASRAAAIALAGNVLGWIGFVPNEQQSEAVSLALAMLFGPGVGVFFLAAAALLLIHPIDDARRRRVLRILERREQRAAPREAAL